MNIIVFLLEITFALAFLSFAASSMLKKYGLRIRFRIFPKRYKAGENPSNHEYDFSLLQDKSKESIFGLRIANNSVVRISLFPGKRTIRCSAKHISFENRELQQLLNNEQQQHQVVQQQMREYKEDQKTKESVRVYRKSSATSDCSAGEINHAYSHDAEKRKQQIESMYKNGLIGKKERDHLLLQNEQAYQNNH